MRKVSIVFVVFVMVISLISLPVIAQQTFSDDFEDGDTNGWVGENIQISGDSIEASWSYQQSDGYPSFSDRGVWDAGPTLDLSEQFLIEGVMKPDLGDRQFAVRIGIINETNQGPQLIFEPTNNITYLGDVGDASPTGKDQISNDFDGQWVHFKINGTQGTMRAKVWPYGDPEPSNWQLEESFSTQSGPFATNPGVAEHSRFVYIDSVTTEGTVIIEQDSGLELEFNQFMKHGTQQPYKVYDSVNDEYVTNQANVSSSNPDVVSVSTSNNTLLATSNITINEEITINATYQSAGAERNVTVANQTIDNIAIMPSSQWLAAALGFGEEGNWFNMGSEIQFILLAIFIGAAAGWKARNEYMGIGVIILAIILLWVADHISIGIVMVAVFYGMFAAYQSKETPSRSDTKVGAGLQQANDRFNR